MATINVSAPSSGNDIYSNVSNAVSSASSGDIIVLPTGNFTFGGKVTLDKALTIQGQGWKNTILYRSESSSDSTILGWGSFFYMTDSCTISGIAFKSKRPSETSGDGFSTVLDYGIQINYVSGFEITDCRFENFGNAAIEVKHLDSIANGVIRRSFFYHNYKGSDGQGFGYGVVIYGQGITWVADPELGTSNFIFVEDNYFNGHRHSVASAGCGKYVFRYNTIDYNIVAGPYIHAIDTHEARGPGNGINTLGSRASEIYGNVINSAHVNGSYLADGQPMNTVVEKAIAIKSGDAIVYNNYTTGFRFGITTTNAYTAQPATVKLWYWNNYVTQYVSNPNKSSLEFYNYNPTYFLQGTHYNAFAKPGYASYTYPHP